MIDKKELLGTISLDAKIKGSGVKLNDLDARFDGIVQQLEFKNYNYKDINIDGTFKQREFKGNLTINDKNVDLEFKGK